DLDLPLPHELGRRLRHGRPRPPVLGLLPKRPRRLLIRLLDLALAVRLLALLGELVRPGAGKGERRGHHESQKETCPESPSIVHDSLHIAPLSAGDATCIDTCEVNRVGWQDVGKLLLMFGIERAGGCTSRWGPRSFERPPVPLILVLESEIDRGTFRQTLGGSRRPSG